MKRPLLSAAAILAAVAVLAPVIVRWKIKSESAAFVAEARELGPAPVHAPESAERPNAAEIYLKAGALRPLPDADSLRKMRQAATRPWSDPTGEWAAMLDAERAALEQVKFAARLPDCDFLPKDAVRVNHATPRPQLGGLLRIVRLLVLDSRRAQSEGRTDDALADQLAVLGAARHLRSQRYLRLIPELSAKAVLDEDFDALGALLADGRLTEKDYEALIDALVPLDRPDKSAADAIADDRTPVTALAELAARHELWFLPASARERLVTDYERAEEQEGEALSAAFEKIDPGSFADRRKALEGRFRLPAAQKPSPALGCFTKYYASFGDCLAANPLGGEPVTYEKLILPLAETAARVEILRAAVAVRLAELRRKAPPTALSEVSTTHPFTDPFAGFTPLRYIQDEGGWTIYSLGPDGKDDRGTVVYVSPEDPDWRNPAPGDIGVSCPLLETLKARRKAKPARR